MDLNLAEISRYVAQGAHAVITIDGAGWHQPGGLLKVPDNISPLPLPPHSPQLNPQEDVWQYLRQNYPSNRVSDTCDMIVDACCHAWNRLAAQPDRNMLIAIRDLGQQVTV